MTSETGPSPTETTKTEAFRTVQAPEAPKPLAETNKDQPVSSYETADGVFIGYESDNGVPYVVDHYGLKETFQADPNAYLEVADISKYLEDLVTSGQLDNSIDAVKAKIKQLEKMSGVDETERVNMKLTRLAEYAKFENRVNEAKRNSIKWSR